jgi:hypothetical protein
MEHNYYYSDMIHREAFCPGCRLKKWLYAWTDIDLDRSVDEFYRAHVLCFGDEVDIVTGEVVW